MSKSLFLFVLSVASFLPFAAGSAQSGVRTDYVLRLGNIKFAKATYQTRIDGSHFEISGNYATTGLVRVIKKASGKALATGKLDNSGFSPDIFKLDYKNGDRKKSIDIGFSGGKVTRVDETPARTSYPENWVALTDGDLSHAADPLTAFFVSASHSACQGTIPLFDGETRMDLKLKRKGSANMRIKGKLMTVEVCRVDFNLKSGYHKGRSDLEKVEERQGIEIWFAKSSIANVYAPVRMEVPTKIGTVTVFATRFES